MGERSPRDLSPLHAMQDSDMALERIVGEWKRLRERTHSANAKGIFFQSDLRSINTCNPQPLLQSQQQIVSGYRGSFERVQDGRPHLGLNFGLPAGRVSHRVRQVGFELDAAPHVSLECPAPRTGTAAGAHYAAHVARREPTSFLPYPLNEL